MQEGDNEDAWWEAFGNARDLTPWRSGIGRLKMEEKFEFYMQDLLTTTRRIYGAMKEDTKRKPNEKRDPNQTVVQLK